MKHQIFTRTTIKPATKKYNQKYNMKTQLPQPFGFASLLCLTGLFVSMTLHASDLTVDNLTVNGKVGVGISPGELNLNFPANKVIGSLLGDFTIQAGRVDFNNPGVAGKLTLLGANSYENAGTTITIDGGNEQITMSNDDGDSFAMGVGDNHIYANHTDLTLTSENTIRLISENPLAIRGYSSGLDSILFNGDEGSASFANGKVQIDGDGKIGVGVSPGPLSLGFPADKVIGSTLGDFTVQAGQAGEVVVPGKLSLIAADTWGSDISMIIDGRNHQVTMDNMDGDSFAFGSIDNHIYANQTDLTFTSENTIRLISENPLAIRGYSSGLDSILFNGDEGSASFAGKVGIGTTSPATQLHVVGGDVKVEGGKFVGNGGGLLIPPQGDLSMGTFTSGQQP